jgi:hypothetical protein
MKIQRNGHCAEVVNLGHPGDPEYRVFFDGGLIAATWLQPGPAEAHRDLLLNEYSRPVYAEGCHPTEGDRATR